MVALDRLTVERDSVTMQIASKSFLNKFGATQDAQRSRSLNVDYRDFAKHLTFLHSIKDYLKSIRSKEMQNRTLFVPKAEQSAFDGKFFFRQGADKTYIAVPFISKKGTCHVACCDCMSIKSDRGLCWMCSPKDLYASSNNKPAFFAGDWFILIKDHAVRRAMERSPIKTYEAALSMILWAMFKAERSVSESMLVVDPVSPHDGDVVDASTVVYSSFGKLVGTRFTDSLHSKAKRGAAIVLINTYLTDEMLARGEMD